MQSWDGGLHGPAFSRPGPFPPTRTTKAGAKLTFLAWALYVLRLSRLGAGCTVRKDRGHTGVSDPQALARAGLYSGTSEMAHPRDAGASERYLSARWHVMANKQSRDAMHRVHVHVHPYCGIADAVFRLLFLVPLRTTVQ